ncbi:MAG: hypothetical protein ABF335_05345 [Alphaproteobacteria bacterium]
MGRFPRPFGGSRKDQTSNSNAPQTPANAANDTAVAAPDYDPPATNTDLAVLMLREAGRIFRAIAAENPDMQVRMDSLAGAYEAVADLTDLDPEGEAPDGAENLARL